MTQHDRTAASTYVWQNTEIEAMHASDGVVSIYLQHFSLTISCQRSHASVTPTYRHARSQFTVLFTHMNSYCWVFRASSPLWQYWSLCEIRDWSVWLCRNVQYCILNPWQPVCFDRCTKACKEQSRAGTCEAHWVWIDSSWALRSVSSVGRQLSLRGLLYSGKMLKYWSSIDGLS